MSTDKARDAAERLVAVCDVLTDMAQWAVEMGLIRIGEAVHRIPDEVLARFPGQPWRQMVAMRTLAARPDDDLVPRRVWRTVTRDVPALRQYLADVLIPGLDD